MGSDNLSKRKKNDAPIIRVPVSFDSVMGGAIKGLPEIASDTCPASFDEKLETSPILKSGLKCFLEKRGERYSIIILATEVGIVSKRNSAKISKCLELGIKYTGLIVFQKGEYYARFFRETN